MISTVRMYEDGGVGRTGGGVRYRGEERFVRRVLLALEMLVVVPKDGRTALSGNQARQVMM